MWHLINLHMIWITSNILFQSYKGRAYPTFPTFGSLDVDWAWGHVKNIWFIWSLLQSNINKDLNTSLESWVGYMISLMLFSYGVFVSFVGQRRQVTNSLRTMRWCFWVVSTKVWFEVFTTSLLIPTIEIGAVFVYDWFEEK